MNVSLSSVDLGILAKNQLLDQLEPQEMAELVSFARVRNFNQKELIFDKGDPGDSLFVILRGRVGIRTISQDGQEIFLNILEPGDVFGEVALLDGRDRTAGAVAMQTTDLLKIDRGDFIPYLEQHPKLCLRLMKVLCERLRWTSDIIENTIFLDIPRRLAKRLLILADDYGQPVEAGMKLNIKLSQEDLARMVGATRESINKGLSALQSRGAISYERGHIIIRDTEILNELVNESET